MPFWKRINVKSSLVHKVLLLYIYIYFPDDKFTIHGCKGSLISSTTSALLGASWLFIFSTKVFLILKSLLKRLVTVFCLLISLGSLSSYLIIPLVNSSVLNSCWITLQLKICCWSSYVLRTF